MTYYNPHPLHIYLYAFPLLLIGTVAVTVGEEWLYMGIICLLLGLGIGFWIVVAGITREHTDYWEQIERNMKILRSTSEPAVWEAFGFSPPATHTKLLADVSPVDNPKSRWKFMDLGLSPQQLRQFCNGLLRNAPYTEQYWCENGQRLMSGRIFRQMRELFKQDKFIRLNNQRNKRLGYTFTALGRREFLYKFASQEVVATLVGDKQQDPPTLLTDGVPSVPS